MQNSIENAFVVLAGTSVRYGYVKKALIYCTAGIKLFPDSKPISEILGLCRLHSGQPEVALNEVERWDSPTPNMLYVAIKSRMLLGDTASLKPVVAQYLSVQPNQVAK